MDGNRLNELIEAVMKAARGNYSAQIGLTGQDDQFDTLTKGPLSLSVWQPITNLYEKTGSNFRKRDGEST